MYTTRKMYLMFFFNRRRVRISRLFLDQHRLSKKVSNYEPFVTSSRISFLCSSEKGSPITSNNAAPIAVLFWESLPSFALEVSITIVKQEWAISCYCQSDEPVKRKVTEFLIGQFHQHPNSNQSKPRFYEMTVLPVPVFMKNESWQVPGRKRQRLHNISGLVELTI